MESPLTSLSVLLLSIAIPLALVSANSTTPAPLTPDKWAGDIAALVNQSRDAGVQPGGVLFVGSSSIRKWDLAKSFPGFPVINHGFGGSHAADTKHHFEQLVARWQPKVIVFYAGDNDLKDGKSPGQVRNDVAAILDQVEAMSPRPAWIWLPIKPSPSRWPLLAKQREANRLVAELLAERSQRGLSAAVCDTATPLLNADGRPRDELFDKDKLHLSEAGYQVWSEKLRPEIERLLKQS